MSDPTRPDAALADLPTISPYTVVRLNEAQFYLAPATIGEHVAAGLRTLLRESDRGPVLILGTLWLLARRRLSSGAQAPSVIRPARSHRRRVRVWPDHPAAS
ncbi:hypothetical protein AB1484_30185 [Parafrankia sp. FMc6]|uniref:hypothetical protein n=1 Tax=Parafrankia soli TaxID=2599596 RepID=UPI0034D398C2